MKTKSVIIFCYAMLILIGGIIGHVVANSSASLITSSIVAVCLFCCAALMWKGYSMAYQTATYVVIGLLIFFSYRFFLTHKIFPAGVLAIMSGCLAIYLVMQRKKSLKEILEGQ